MKFHLFFYEKTQINFYIIYVKSKEDDKYGVKIIIVNNELLSPQEELVQDIISILHVFSCKIYGMRKYKKRIEEDEEIAKSIQSGNKTNGSTKTEN